MHAHNARRRAAAAQSYASVSKKSALHTQPASKASSCRAAARRCCSFSAAAVRWRAPRERTAAARVQPPDQPALRSAQQLVAPPSAPCTTPVAAARRLRPTSARLAGVRRCSCKNTVAPGSATRRCHRRHALA
jgi:hypothetical protein